MGSSKLRRRGTPIALREIRLPTEFRHTYAHSRRIAQRRQSGSIRLPETQATGGEGPVLP